MINIINFAKGLLIHNGRRIPVKGLYNGHIERISFQIIPEQGKWGAKIEAGEKVYLQQIDNGNIAPEIEFVMPTTINIADSKEINLDKAAE